MQLASFFRRHMGLALTAAGLVVVVGCAGEEKPAPAPNITVNPPAAPPKAGPPSNAGPGSGGANASTDSTLKH